MTLHILVGKICISFFLFYCEGMLSLVVLWLCGRTAPQRVFADRMTVVVSELGYPQQVVSPFGWLVSVREAASSVGSQLRHNLVRWVVSCLRCTMMSCLYQRHILLSRQVQAGVPQESVISLILFNHFVSNCLIPNLDITSYADNSMMLASTPSIVEAEKRANFPQPWWCGWMGYNWPLLPRNPA